MFDYLFLGTGASVPSRDRALPCVAVRKGGDIILFDCGEGSQRQLMISRFSFMKIPGMDSRSFWVLAISAISSS